MRRIAVLLTLAAACTSHELQPSEPSPAHDEPELAAKPEGCGELSYGIHHNPGETFEVIGARRLGTIACATPCDPMPAFARAPEGRNEHGGYGFMELDPSACELPGTTLGVESCLGMCDVNDVLGKFQITLSDQTQESCQRICRALERRWGPPDVGDCDCLDDEIVWYPRASEPGAVLNFMGHYLLDCGFPDGNYLPTHPPR